MTDMGLRRSLVKLTVASGCVLGGVVFPPLLAGEGVVLGTVLATTLGSVAAGNAANVIDALVDGGEDDRVSLQNQDLTKAVGKAIAAVITLAAQQHRGKIRRNLLILAQQRQQESVFFSGVIYSHPRNSSIGDCNRDLELIAKVCDWEDCIDRVQYLPL